MTPRRKKIHITLERLQDEICGRPNKFSRRQVRTRVCICYKSVRNTSCLVNNGPRKSYRFYSKGLMRMVQINSFITFLMAGIYLLAVVSLRSTQNFLLPVWYARKGCNECSCISKCLKDNGTAICDIPVPGSR